MKLGLSLFLLYVAGKAITVAIHRLNFESTIIPVLFWQDLLCAALLALVHRYAKPAAWLLYGIAVLHFAVSMPLLRLMGTPLTAPLLRASSGTLADSMAHHLDALNLALVAGTLLLAGVLPLILRRMRIGFHSLIALTTAVLVLTGYRWTSSSELQGLHRNSLVAFVQSYSRGAEATSLDSQMVQAQSVISPLHGRLAGANVILVGLESTGAKHLSTYGGPTDPMPFLSHLAREAIVFENAYAPYPESIKGLFSLLFSRQPRFGFEPEDLPPDFGPSITSRAAESSYQTALFHSGRFMYLGMDEVIVAADFDRADDGGAIGGNYNSSFGVDDFATVDHLLEWLDQRTNANPFLVHYLPISGHHPYEVPVRGPFAGGTDQRRYLNALHYSDLALEKLVNGLQKRGLLENTLLIVYGDHGEAFGEHPGNYGHTLYLYEENVRVPLIIWMPAKLKPERLARVTSLVDVAPTICDLLGLSSPASFEGISAFNSFDRPAFFSTEYSLRLEGIRFRNWKLILEEETRHIRLYDLERDPSEQTNLAAVHPQIVTGLRRRFFEWREIPSPSTIAAKPAKLAQR
jgi:hypothetical protein